MTARQRNPLRTALAGLGLVLVLALTACAGAQQDDTASDALTYLDTDRFDDNLSEMLKEKPPAVTVSFLDPPAVNAIPPRISQWLAAVEENGGSIGVEGQHPDQKSATVVLAVLALIREGHSMYKENRKFDPTEHYDARVRLADDDERVDGIRFVLRESD